MKAAHIDIEAIPAFQDNYIYLGFAPDSKTAEELQGKTPRRTFLVDPGDASAVLRHLEQEIAIDFILLTHHHHDHIGGADELQRKFHAKLIGPRREAKRIGLKFDLEVDEGDTFHMWDEIEVRVLHIPGHTLGHIAYYFPQSAQLFCGDTLFSLGCGRLFEGTAAQLHASLKAIAALPAQTLAYPAHEYTLSNAAFALSVEPGNLELEKRIAEVRALRAEGKPSLPVLLGSESSCNPFLRTTSPAIKEALGLPAAADELQVFTELRKRKDTFVPALVEKHPL